MRNSFARRFKGTLKFRERTLRQNAQEGTAKYNQNRGEINELQKVTAGGSSDQQQSTDHTNHTTCLKFRLRHNFSYAERSRYLSIFSISVVRCKFSRRAVLETLPADRSSACSINARSICAIFSFNDIPSGGSTGPP